MINIQLIRISQFVDIPTYATDGSAAVDLQASISIPLVLLPGSASVLIPTGLKMYHGNNSMCSMILPRSGLGHKSGLILGNLVGLIDSDYQGELMVSAYVRPGHSPCTIMPLARIAQLIFIPVVKAQFTTVDKFDEPTYRGSGGFGSTGG